MKNPRARAVRGIAMASLFLMAFVSLASAQDATADLATLDQDSRRLREETECLSGLLRRLDDTARLVREASAQMSDARSSAAERRDAQTALESLRQRRAEILREIPRCRREHDTSARARDVIVRDAPPDPIADDVGRDNGDVRALERDTRLSENVHIVVAQQVDGAGTADDASVRNSLRGISGELDRCYERAVGQRALPRGTLILTFTVTPSGSVTRIGIERNTMGEAFGRCVRTAAQRLHPGQSRNGDATFSYSLAFPSP
jgi:outer membrane biosynthesis protein TonB